MQPFKNEYLYFLTLCKTENISEASEDTGIQQSGLSKSLKALEEEFRHPLFYRTNRGLKITPFGKIVQKNLQTSLKNWEDSFDHDVKNLNKIEGDYTLGLHQTIGLNLLYKFYPHVVEPNPQLNLHVLYKRSPEVVSEVLQHGLDFGIAVEPYNHQDLVISPIAKEYMGFWSVYNEPKEKVIYYNPEMIKVVKTLKSVKDFKKIPLEDYESLGSVASSGKGLALLPSPVAARYPKLQLVGKKLQTVSICLIYRYDILKTPATDFILKTIKSNLK